MAVLLSDLVRVTTDLRQNAGLQIRGRIRNGDGGRCGVGQICETFGGGFTVEVADFLREFNARSSRSVVQMNDWDLKTFPEIADKIWDVLVHDAIVDVPLPVEQPAAEDLPVLQAA